MPSLRVAPLCTRAVPVTLRATLERSQVSAPVPPAAGAPRVLSIDILRGADVLLMLFVNEVSGVTGAPAFLLHETADADGMTITDLVFPAFLFIVGIALPFALGGRLRRGESRLEVWRHVVTRALALVVMGVLTVNAEHGVSGLLSAPAWNVLMTLGVLLVWGVPREGWGRIRGPWLRTAGVVLLVGVALAYRGVEATGWFQLRPYWWGILGLIGWAYLGVATLYLLVGDRPAVLTGLVGLYGCVALANGAGGFGWPSIPGPIVGPIVGTHGATVLAGTLLGVLSRRHLAEGGSAWRFAAQVLGYAAGLAAAGLFLHTLHDVHPAFRVSKTHATLPWGLLSSALTCAAWVLVFLLVDVLGWRRWPRSISIAGENPLVAYLMAPFLLSLLALSAPLWGGTDFYEALGGTTGIGLVRSAAFAWLVVRVSGFLRSKGVRVQL
jgi:heparan-alpha-glucosaminide N-acetyltransferase